MQIEDCKLGVQIAYVPNHADGDLFHPDVAYGFITIVRDSAVFCRFWVKDDFTKLRSLS